ncbi:hypothetical protein RHSIM_Rhsim01G0135200 [Rhododendron simsii]|uniref:Uncharacterized protein n=1 Tax=Rhododendron simsii TaxID=118357 RepID=A0A834HJZ0_RHOSS|nr:hypothetical protein RHSIM_Rhsim01G0135200 [Rhododendron simsii]
MKVSSKAYNDQMDIGTTQFALYYMEWLKVGAQNPHVPSVPLPSRTINGSSRRSLDSFTSRSSVNKSFHMGINDLIMTWKTHVPPRAIMTICSSKSLTNCEMAIRVITKTWLDSHGDPSIEKTLSNAQVMEGMLKVLFISNDDEVLELIISILEEFSMRNDAKNSNPQLVVFLRLSSSSLFLKAPPDLMEETQSSPTGDASTSTIASHHRRQSLPTLVIADAFHHHSLPLRLTADCCNS